MSVPLLLNLMLAYGAMLGFCLGQARNCKQLLGREPQVCVCAIARLAGLALLVGCYVSCVSTWGAPIGTVACLGLFSVSGLMVAGLMTYSPRLALSTPALLTCIAVFSLS